MAIWQVPFYFVWDEDQHLEVDTLKALNELAAAFPEEKHWCAKVRQFGKLDSTCLEFCFVDGWVSLRIDLRSITKKELELLVRFAKVNDLKVEYENEIYESTFDNFVAIFKESDSYRFLNNPNDYLDSLSKRDSSSSEEDL